MKLRSHVLLLTVAAALPTAEARIYQWDGSAEVMATDDIRLISGFLAGAVELGETTELGIQLQLSDTRIDYQPNAAIDPLGFERTVDDTLTGLSLSLEAERGRHLYRVSGSSYTGFRSFTSLWLDEYYRQQYGGGGIPGVSYEDPDPYGASIDFSYRYELTPTTRFLTVSAGFLKDRVAPGYEIEDLGTAFELVRGETHLETWTAAVEYEGVINKQMRTRQSLRVTDTETRDIRLSWNGALNVFLGGNWIARTTASFAQEDPDFEAWSVSQAIETTIAETWIVGLTARYYEDTGQIETANLVSSAAPALDSHQVFVTLRREFADGESGFSLSFGPYFTRYAETGIGTERFSELYSDRDWWWTRIAFRKQF